MEGKTEISEEEARDFSERIKKLLQSKDIWSTITEVNEPELKFIKIEASIKVKGSG